MYKELINKENDFQIIFTEINGGGWLNDLFTLIKQKLHPNSIEKNIISASWEEMEAEILISKDKIDTKIEIDDIGTISYILLSESSNFNKQKLREWATIIATEVEKLKNK